MTLISNIYGAAGSSRNLEKEKLRKKRRKLKMMLRKGKISKGTYMSRMNEKKQKRKKKGPDLLNVPGTVRGYR